LEQEASVSAQAPTPDRDPEEALVHEALRALGPRDREILLLAEWEGLTPAQIASVVGCLTVTARGRLHRARHRFREAFEELLDANTVRRRPTASQRPATAHVREGGS
jgi:RNA polymerase sigma-70 factor (ECF subfamily)